MATAVEHAVEVDWVEFPARCDGRHVLVQSSYQGNVAGARLGRDARVRYPKCAMLEDARAQEGRKMARFFVGGGGGVGVGEGLEGFVGAEAVTCNSVSFAQ